MMKTGETQKPKMDPRALMELAALTGEIDGKINVLRSLQDSHTRPGSMALVIGALDRSVRKLQELRAECEVLI